MDVANLIASRRAELDLSRSKFGRLIDVEGATVYAWETGRAKPDHVRLCALVEKAGMDPAALLAVPDGGNAGDGGVAA